MRAQAGPRNVTRTLEGRYNGDWMSKFDSIRVNLTIYVAFDFEAAFPSVIHLWIWVVLHRRKMPGRFINLFQAIHKDAKAEYSHNGITYTLGNFLSGVLQGCPASAFLFLTRFHNTLRSNNAGIVRACADDIGISIVRLKHLLLIAPVFKECRIFAGLKLKPIKCVLVPLCMFTPKVHDSI